MAIVVISPAQIRTLQSALFDLNNSQTEMDVLGEAGVDVQDIAAIRDDLRKNLEAYLRYAQQQGKVK